MTRISSSLPLLHRLTKHHPKHYFSALLMVDKLSLSLSANVELGQFARFIVIGGDQMNHCVLNQPVAVNQKYPVIIDNNPDYAASVGFTCRVA